MAKHHPIKILPQSLVSQIAAGEVIERPASVVKELMENAIDAEASVISVSIEKGGTQLIEVTDNGIGMDEVNAKLAFTQHATSKLLTADDLENILTLGFRGEALASIASISESRLHSYDGDHDPVVVEAVADGAKTSLGEGRQQGTTVTIRNLFQTVPARRKFMRSLETEYKHILETFTAISLAHEQIGFQLIKDGKRVFDLPATESKLDRIRELFHYQAQDLIPVSVDSPEVKMSGFLGHPRTAKPLQLQQYTFLNGRAISDRLISKAVKEGFATSLARNQQPPFFLYININPSLVDVNVHPRKLEVRFVNPGAIYSLVYNAVSQVLQKKLQLDLKERFSGPGTDTLSNAAFASNHSDQALDLSDRTMGGATKRQEISQSLAFTKNLLEPLAQRESPHTEQVPQFPVKAFYKVTQFLNTYLILEEDERLLIIDQHAADERVKFEAIQGRQLQNKSLPQQSLLMPEVLELSSIETALANEHNAYLASLGFMLEPFSSNSLQLTAIPLLLAKTSFITTLKSILADLSQTEGRAEQSLRMAKEKIIATMACHGSIRAGMKIGPQEAEQLVKDLFACKLPYSCPHGRPIIWEISRYDLEKHFKRKL